MNEAFRILMTRRKTDNSILGQPFYKLLAQEEFERHPRMATCHSPLGDFDEHVVRLLRRKTRRRTSKEKGADASHITCKIHVKPIFNLMAQQEPATQCLLHYAAVLEEVRVPLLDQS
jgi:hypothetical protein